MFHGAKLNVALAHGNWFLDRRVWAPEQCGNAIDVPLLRPFTARMRSVGVALAFAGLLAGSGCAGNRNSASAPGAILAPAPGATTIGLQDGRPIVTPETGLVGRVALINPQARFAVLTFPIGQMAADEQQLCVYRSGLKVGELKATAMRSDLNLVADIIAGEVAVGDEVRDK
jgi:hypothetical protein